MIKIRKENSRDYSSIKELSDLAFGQTEESELIDKLRRNDKKLLALVAVDEKKRVGHILFTLAIIDTNKGPVQGMGLAPMSVLPKYQNNGIGSLLVKKGPISSRYGFVIHLFVFSNICAKQLYCISFLFIVEFEISQSFDHIVTI